MHAYLFISTVKLLFGYPQNRHSTVYIDLGMINKDLVNYLGIAE